MQVEQLGVEVAHRAIASEAVPGARQACTGLEPQDLWCTLLTLPHSPLFPGLMKRVVCAMCDIVGRVPATEHDRVVQITKHLRSVGGTMGSLARKASMGPKFLRLVPAIEWHAASNKSLQLQC